MGHYRFARDGLAVCIAARQPGQNPVNREIKDGPEPGGPDVQLVLGVVLKVSRREVPVLGDIPSGSCRPNTESRNQFLAPQFAAIAQTQLDERQAVALSLRQVRGLG